MSKAHNDDAGWLFDLGGASALAGATGFAFFKLGPPDFLPFGAAVVVSLAFLATYSVLKRIGNEPAALPLGNFAAAEIELEPEPEALLLDDILASMGPDSRVVRLFAPDQMPTAGQLKERIDRHIGGATDADAADALHQALAEIRKSLR
jgi:hypothetical protein